MSRTVKLAVFGVVALAQLAVPGWMIAQREMVLERGTPYKFRTAPVDPYDAFRGRYVWLNFEETTVPYTGGGLVPYGRPVYVAIETAEDGFARLTAASQQPPASGDYLRVEGYWYQGDNLSVQLPFDRYYMNEDAAPQAEIAVREHSLVNNRDAYVVVRVLNGQSVLEQLYVADTPIEEFILQSPDAP